MKTKKVPNILVFVIIGVLIMLAVYLFFRTREKIDEQKSAEAGNWFTNLFST
jgi:type II secretory pathway pseudopilin PulG